jgi:REP element-mobilizing transposase RayT
MHPNDLGSIAAQKWLEIPTHYQNVSLDAYVVMPNHLHGIVIIKEQTNATLGQIIGWYKFQAMQEINRKRRTLGRPVWQRGYYEHIIRRTENMISIREYIVGNPAKWAEDEYNRM